MIRPFLTLCFIINLACGSYGIGLSANFQNGMEAYNRGDYTTAINKWILLAEDGDAKAQYFLGEI